MHPITLAGLGWSAHFLRQLSLDEIGRFPPARVTTVHRDRIEAVGEGVASSFGLPPGLPTSDIAVGDWVLTEGQGSPGQLGGAPGRGTVVPAV